MKSAGMMNINTDKHSISSVVVVVVFFFFSVLYHFILSGNSTWDFLGVNFFGPGIFLEALWILGAY